MSFLRTILKWLGALVVAYFVLFMLAFLGLILLALSMKPTEQGFEPGSLLVYDLNLDITDTPSFEGPAEVLQQALSDETYATLSLHEVLKALETAAHDERIKGLVLTGSLYPSEYGNSLATMQELRRALEAFKASGKPIYAYLDNDSTGELLLKSTADHVVMNRFGYLEFKGLAWETPYLGDFLQKYGIEVQVARVGKYKSAAESLASGQMSPEERAQRSALLGDIWLAVRQALSEDRNTTVEDLQALSDTQPLLTPEAALKAGLVDELLYPDEMIARLREETGESDRGADFRQVGLVEYQASLVQPAMPTLDLSEKPAVAVIYAEGVIVDGMGGEGQVGGDTVAQYLREAREDPSVHAIVLRVNSPGGSATASERILRELRITREKKPVFVSMGGLAASGGYWISSLADTIYAEPMTITGSIGVISMVPNVAGLAEEHAVHFERVQTSQHADLYTISRPRTPEEMALMQDVVEHFYQGFLDRVSEGRDLPRERVHEIAQGRVWTGIRALDLGLVDKIGGLEDTIAAAGAEAKLGDDFRVVQYPARVTFEDWLEQHFSNQPEQVRSQQKALLSDRLFLGRDPASQGLRQIEQQVRLLRRLNDPAGIYAIEPSWVRVE